METVVRILSVRAVPSAKQRFGVNLHAIVQSRSRGTRLNHQVVRRGANQFRCSCESSLFQKSFCEHCRVVRDALRNVKGIELLRIARHNDKVMGR